MNGEKKFENVYVIKIFPELRKAFLYTDSLVMKYTNHLLPDFYTNYSGFYEVSLGEATLLNSRTFISAEYLKEVMNADSAADMLQEIHIDSEKNLAVVSQTSSENKSEKKSMERIHLRGGYPVWDTVSAQFIGIRFMDIVKGGLFYVIIPPYIKEPLPCTIQILGRETVTTKAGSFKTLKLSFSISDPFLGRMIQVLNRQGSYFIWKEDSERGLLVKLDSQMMKIELEDIGIWKEK